MVSNATSMNKIFYGASIGFGLDFKSNPTKTNYWTFAIIIPFRGTSVDDYLKEKNITLQSDLLPIGISVGYRFVIN